MSGFLFTKAQRYYNIFGDKEIDGSINAWKHQREKEIQRKLSHRIRESPKALVLWARIMKIGSNSETICLTKD